MKRFSASKVVQGRLSGWSHLCCVYLFFVLFFVHLFIYFNVLKWRNLQKYVRRAESDAHADDEEGQAEIFPSAACWKSWINWFHDNSQWITVLLLPGLLRKGVSNNALSGERTFAEKLKIYCPLRNLVYDCHILQTGLHPFTGCSKSY